MLPEGITPGPWDDSKDKGGTAAAFQRVTLGGAVEFHGKTEPAKDPCWVFHHQLELNTVWRGPNSKKRGDHYLKNPENRLRYHPILTTGAWPKDCSLRAAGRSLPSPRPRPAPGPEAHGGDSASARRGSAARGGQAPQGGAAQGEDRAEEDKQRCGENHWCLGKQSSRMLHDVTIWLMLQCCGVKLQHLR